MISAHNEKNRDRRFGIHTCGDDESRSDHHHSPYQPTPYCVLDRIAEYQLIRRGDLLIDYGCGKGRVSVFMSKETGCDSIGIEYDPRLCAEAEANARAYERVRFECCSAETYAVPPTANRFYFFNPFSLVILKRVVHRIMSSLEAFPRQVFLIFYFPVEDLEFLSYEGFQLAEDINCNDLFHTMDSRERILVYRN